MEVPMTRATATKAGRIAGWAAAFGIGCAVAAAPAAAAPDDSAGSSALSNSSSISNSVGSKSVRTATTPASTRARVRVRATPQTPQPPSSAAVDAAALASKRKSGASGRHPGTTAADSAAADSAALAIGRGTPIVIFKGTHFSLPRQTVLWVKNVTGHATFTENSIYDLNSEDQYDWNKLTGITFTPLRPDTDAIMVAWRYNLDSQMFEIGPYYNKDLARIMPTDDQIISVPLGEEFDFAVDYNGITLTYGDQTVYKPLPEGLVPNFWTSERISSWFGGTSVAPKTVSYFMHLSCPWLSWFS